MDECISNLKKIPSQGSRDEGAHCFKQRANSESRLNELIQINRRFKSTD